MKSFLGVAGWFFSTPYKSSHDAFLVSERGSQSEGKLVRPRFRNVTFKATLVPRLLADTFVAYLQSKARRLASVRLPPLCSVEH